MDWRPGPTAHTDRLHGWAVRGPQEHTDLTVPVQLEQAHTGQPTVLERQQTVLEEQQTDDHSGYVQAVSSPSRLAFAHARLRVARECTTGKCWSHRTIPRGPQSRQAQRHPV